MRMNGVSLADFSASVARVNASYDGNLKVHNDAHEMGVKRIDTVGRLDVISSRENGARTSSSGRHVKAACWHAFRDVIRDILKHHPAAVITTSMARYTAENFEDVYPDTAYNNVGSMVAPAYMPDLCVGDCAGDSH